ncbi:MAG: DUF4743 domain-containing protein, partial [Burkholderiaceae bacterium]|nr:DUF4743 domain-containing protein [Burkholderiaceae bacterium]
MPDAARLRRLAESLHARAHPALPVDLIPVVFAGVNVGDAQPAVAQFLAQQMPAFKLDRALSIEKSMDAADLNAVLAKAARQLHAAGLIKGWRDELLSVGSPPVAAIERAACRALG